jgi:drug/metabolite transporter (DMT)-like permease
VTGLIIMSSEVLMLAVLGRLILKEKISWIEAGAIALGFTGAVLVGWAASQAGLGDLWSGLAFAIAALCAAGYAIAVRFFTLKNPATDIFAITWGQTLVAVGLGFIALPFTTEIGDTAQVMSALPTQAWLAAIGAGVFGVAIPFLLFAEAARQVPARHAAISLNVIPVVGISLGALLGRGLPTTWQYAGGVLVLISLFALTLVADEEKISH